MKVIGVINIFLVPFLIILSAVYIVFRYGEIIYTKSAYITTKEWSKRVRYTRFRRYDELPHQFDARLHAAKKHTDNYLSCFRPNLLYNIAQLLLELVGIIFVIFVLGVISNFNFLVKFKLWGKSCIQILSILFSTIVVLKTFLNKYTGNHDGKTAGYHLNKTAHALGTINSPEWIIILNSPGTKETHHQITKWYHHRIWIILSELIGIVLLPYIFLKTIPDFANELIHFFENNTHYSETINNYVMVPNDVNVTV